MIFGNEIIKKCSECSGLILFYPRSGRSGTRGFWTDMYNDFLYPGITEFAKCPHCFEFIWEGELELIGNLSNYGRNKFQAYANLVKILEIGPQRIEVLKEIKYQIKCSPAQAKIILDNLPIDVGIILKNSNKKELIQYARKVLIPLGVKCEINENEIIQIDPYPIEWKRAKPAVELDNILEWIEGLKSGVNNLNQERIIRIYIWQNINRFKRFQYKEELSGSKEFLKDNLTNLKKILRTDDICELLMKIDLYRQEGEFNEALELIEVQDAPDGSILEYYRELIERKEKNLLRIPQEHASWTNQMFRRMFS